MHPPAGPPARRLHFSEQKSCSAFCHRGLFLLLLPTGNKSTWDSPYPPPWGTFTWTHLLKAQ